MAIRIIVVFILSTLFVGCSEDEAGPHNLQSLNFSALLSDHKTQSLLEKSLDELIFFAAEGRYKKIWSDLLSEGFKSNNSKELFDQLIRDWKISSLDVLSIDRYSNNIFVIVRVSEEVKRVKYISFQNLIFNISEDEIFLETFPFMASQGLFRQPFCFYGDLWKR